MIVYCLVFVVGYVVGLGDRHVQNILVDCNTAELVHIDLGKKREKSEAVVWASAQDMSSKSTTVADGLLCNK